MAIVNLTVKVEENLKKRFKTKAIKNDKTMQQVFTELIKAYVNRQVN